MAGPADSPDERDAIELSDAILYRMAYGLASDLTEARNHRLAGRPHDAPGAGGDAAEVRRRLDVAPGRAALVREAIADALEGRRPRW